MKELAFDTGLQIAGFDAIDYFDDGSFYLLHTPGHAVGHLGGLARTTSDPSTFILMIGDCAHHAGELRPSDLRPLPEHIVPNPLEGHLPSPCLGELFLKSHPKHSRTEPFFKVPDPPLVPMATYDMPENHETVRKCTKIDANENIFVIMAHDASLKDIVEYFPKTANDWKKQSWGQKGRWAFLKEFKDAII